MDSVYVLRVRGCNKAGYGEYSEEVYLHTPPAPGGGARMLAPLIGYFCREWVKQFMKLSAKTQNPTKCYWSNC